MNLHLRKSLCLLLLSVLATFYAKAQTLPVLTHDKTARAIERFHPPLIQSRMDGPDTLSISASQPFFEDFSTNAVFPNASLWFNPELSSRGIPLQTKNAAINPPSRGVVSFDGLDETGLPYDIEALSFGKADLLLSHFIDLSGFNAASNLVLSFYLQPGGKSEAPEASDSFFVSFLTPADTFQVYSQAGDNANFNRISIPINNPAWFVKEFQLAFENKGSLNGALDVWHLDYIELGPNRSVNMAPPNDQSAIGLVNTPLAPFSRIPLKHFPSPTNRMQAFSAEFSNLSSSSKSVMIQDELKESFLSTPLTPPFTESQNTNLAASSNSQISFSPFGEQNISAISVLSLDIGISNANDAHPENDQFTTKFSIDSVLGYDDGEAERGFGLNRPFGFGVQVSIEQPDSISAVWISFVPTVNFNPVSNAIDYMDEKSFRFRIWSFPHPDSILFEQVNDMKVNYGTEANTYIRYPLNRKVAVSGTFWVGLQQLNTLPIGVGYDLSYDNDAFCYYDSSGVWTSLNLGGSLMIRPEFFNTTEVVLDIDESIDASVRLYPNPLSGRNVNVGISNFSQVRNYTAVLLDAFGKKVFEYKHQGTAFEKIQIELPKNLPQGLYIWQHTWETQAQPKHIKIEKLLISSNN